MPAQTVGLPARMISYGRGDDRRVGKLPTTEYWHFAAPVADRATAGLIAWCPWLVADHCYRLEHADRGGREKAACSDSRTGSPDSGLLVQVTRHLDIARPACPAGGGSYAWPYHHSARTYCTAALF